MPAVPDYQRIVDDVRSKVRSGELSPGDKLPTKREMAVSYDVSMNTVDRALLILTSEGTIIGHQGKGLFVPDPPPVSDT